VPSFSVSPLAGDLDCSPNIGLLAAFGSTAEQDDDGRTALQEIDPVAGPVVDPHLANAFTDCLHVAGIAEREAVDSYLHSCTSSTVSQFREPLGECRRLDDLDYRVNVNHSLHASQLWFTRSYDPSARADETFCNAAGCLWSG
jgi:hypothetical protein